MRYCSSVRLEAAAAAARVTGSGSALQALSSRGAASWSPRTGVLYFIRPTARIADVRHIGSGLPRARAKTSPPWRRGAPGGGGEGAAAGGGEVRAGGGFDPAGEFELLLFVFAGRVGKVRARRRPAGAPLQSRRFFRRVAHQVAARRELAEREAL